MSRRTRAIVNRMVIYLAVVVATLSRVDAADAPCPIGEYYAPALGGYILLPVRYVHDSSALEPGVTGIYKSPAPPMLRNCPLAQVRTLAGLIESGDTETMSAVKRLPKSKPVIKTSIREFSVTVWRFTLPNDVVGERTTALIVRGDQALRVFDMDSQLWRRIIDSYESE